MFLRKRAHEVGHPSRVRISVEEFADLEAAELGLQTREAFVEDQERVVQDHQSVADARDLSQKMRQVQYAHIGSACLQLGDQLQNGLLRRQVLCYTLSQPRLLVGSSRISRSGCLSSASRMASFL